MKIILKQDVKNLGFKDDVVTVKNGYGNNYLIPRGYGAVATSGNLKMLAENVKQATFKQDRILKDANELSAKLEGKTFTIHTKAGSSGRIFGAVTPLQLAQAIKAAEGADVDRRRIVFEKDIKELGTYEATLNLHKTTSVKVNVEVVAE
jgi:large subunit ribosomal protein L9